MAHLMDGAVSFPFQVSCKIPNPIRVLQPFHLPSNTIYALMVCPNRCKRKKEGSETQATVFCPRQQASLLALTQAALVQSWDIIWDQTAACKNAGG